jgi:DNA repair protein RadC
MSYNMKQLIINEEAIHNLEDDKLLALILSSGMVRYCTLEKSAQILRACQNNLQKLYATPLTDMLPGLGIPPADSIRLKASLELAKRRQIAEVLAKPKISRSEDAYKLFQYLGDTPYEEFWIISLSRANKVIDCYKVSEGGVSGTVVDPKRIFHHILGKLGSSLVLIHNHPSGNIQPSDADQVLTRKIVDGGRFLDISVLDHIIIGNNDYYSFADNGIL